LLITALFLLPALVLLGALVVYPIVFSVVRSTYDRTGDAFVGIDNYRRMFESRSTLIAVRNTALWVVLVPAVVTSLGLIFAVLTERVSWGTAFKVVIFMPMAISFLSAGVIWRIVFENDPQRGLLNAGLQGVVDVARPPGPYPGARPSEQDLMRAADDGFVTVQGTATNAASGGDGGQGTGCGRVGDTLSRVSRAGSF
jgi:ABC-type sugar transport system permease subunit